MPVEKTEIFSGFFRFSPFSGTSLSKCGFSQNSNLIKNKKMPNADFDRLHGIGQTIGAASGNRRRHRPKGVFESPKIYPKLRS